MQVFVFCLWSEVSGFGGSGVLFHSWYLPWRWPVNLQSGHGSRGNSGTCPNRHQIGGVEVTCQMRSQNHSFSLLDTHPIAFCQSYILMFFILIGQQMILNHVPFLNWRASAEAGSTLAHQV